MGETTENNTLNLTESCEEKVEKLHEEVAEKVEKLHEEVAEKVEKLHGEVAGKVEKLHEEGAVKVEKLHEEVAEKVEKLHEEGAEKVKEKPSEVKQKTIEDKIKTKAVDKTPQTAGENCAAKQVQRISGSVPCCPKEPREKIIRNQSDIFSLKDIATTLQTSIFSVNGSPSRRVFRKQEPAGHVFPKNENPPSDKPNSPKRNRITRENYNDEKRPSSSYRNPLTGTGLSSNDEYKSKGIKRKDGNPLLGLGYDSEIASSSSQHRIPPGGYSHKLW